MIVLEKTIEELFEMGEEDFDCVRKLGITKFGFDIEFSDDDIYFDMLDSTVGSLDCTLEVLKEGFEKEDKNKIVLDADTVVFNRDGEIRLLTGEDYERCAAISAKKVIIEDNTLITLII